MELVIAEKPSVARDIARVLGATARGDGCLRGEAHVVTWCIGHLVELEEPGAYSEAWKKWRLDSLPMVPEAFRLRPSKGSEAQWRVVRELLRSKQFAGVVNACDAGREGELIFRYCYELAGSRLPVKRLWISSMTDSALRAGLNALRPGAQYDALADAARCRAEADWLVGMNATRAVTTRSRPGAGGVLLSIGRVQTPTLALVVDRERAIRAFVPRDYWEVHGRFTTAEGTFNAIWSHHAQKRLASAALAAGLVARLGPHVGAPTGPRVERLERKAERQPPPQLFDLTSLQRTANKRYGLSAQRTLDLAQALYETHKLVTYPRTDSRHLSGDIRGELPNIFRALTSSPDHAAFARVLLGSPPGPTPRVFQDSRVTDHHAIIPTSKAPSGRLDRDEQRIHDLIVRRFLGAFYPDAEFALTTLVVLVGPDAPPEPAPDPPPARDTPLAALPAAPDRFQARGKVLLKAGWREVAGLDGIDDSDHRPGRDGGSEDDEPAQRLPPVAQGQPLDGRYSSSAKKTRPPPRYSEAALLSAMEFAGREMDDDALRLALKERGLGTPATRASMIETLLRRTYLERQQKNVVPTALGEALIDALPGRSLASAELTGEWEGRLARMARGEESRAVFMGAIVDYVREVVEQVRQSTPATLAGGQTAAGPTVGPCPLCQGSVVEGFKAFGCQQCAFKLWKTIAGKTISGKLAGLLLRTRRSAVLPGFRSKAGKPFQAALELDASGQVRLAFDSGPGQAPRAPGSEEGADDEGVASSQRNPSAPFTPNKQAPATRGAPPRAASGAPGARVSGGAGGARGPAPRATTARATNGRPVASLSAASVASLSLAANLEPIDEPEPTPRPKLPPPAKPKSVGAPPGQGASGKPPVEAPPEQRASGGEPGAVLAADEVMAMGCPRCGQGHLMIGRKAWGCSRWREGCTLVVPFAVGGKPLTAAHLRELITKGRTARKARWELAGQAAQGRLRLDLTAEPPALVVEP